MDVFEAIAEMRRLSELKIPFSFSFMSYSLTRRKSEGIIEVRKARLAKQSRRNQSKYKNYMMDYIDLLTGERHTCWQPLLLTFNDHELKLS